MNTIKNPISKSRRSFLKSATAVGLYSGPLKGILQAASPNGKVQHAAIGVGGMGWGDLNQIASHPNTEIVAVCDIDTQRAAKAVAAFPNARFYQDWRELLDKESDRIDSVNVSVPDHMHAPITMNALNLGKHVYCQKPLTHNLYESRQITAAAKRAGVVTQMGIQLSSTIASRMATEMVQKGAIGKVKKAYLWSNKDTSRYRPIGPRPDKQEPIPAGLDWDGWCGVAPMRPYVHGVYHPTWWRGWQDFGCGWLGDMGCHIMDMPYRALRLGMPVSVHAEVEGEWRDDPARRAETFPTWQIVRYTYPGTEMTSGDTIDIIWSDGYKYPPAGLTKFIDGLKYPSQGAMLIGENGTMLLPHGEGPRFFPAEKLKSLTRPKLRPLNHYHQFVDKILGKTDALVQADFDYAGPLTEMILLGTVALRFPGSGLNWNASEMKITNEPGAERLIRRAYRKEWKVKGL